MKYTNFTNVIDDSDVIKEAGCTCALKVKPAGITSIKEY